MFSRTKRVPGLQFSWRWFTIGLPLKDVSSDCDSCTSGERCFGNSHVAAFHRSVLNHPISRFEIFSLPKCPLFRFQWQQIECSSKNDYEFSRECGCGEKNSSVLLLHVLYERPNALIYGHSRAQVTPSGCSPARGAAHYCRRASINYSHLRTRHSSPPPHIRELSSAFFLNTPALTPRSALPA